MFYPDFSSPLVIFTLITGWVSGGGGCISMIKTKKYQYILWGLYICRYWNVRAAKSGDFSFSSYSLHNNPGVETAIDHQPQKRNCYWWGKVDQQPQKKNCHRWGKVHHSIKREKHRDHMVMHSNMRAVCKIVLQPPMQVHVYQQSWAIEAIKRWSDAMKR